VRDDLEVEVEQVVVEGEGGNVPFTRSSTDRVDDGSNKDPVVASVSGKRAEYTAADSGSDPR